MAAELAPRQRGPSVQWAPRLTRASSACVAGRKFPRLTVSNLLSLLFLSFLLLLLLLASC